MIKMDFLMISGINQTKGVTIKSQTKAGFTVKPKCRFIWDWMYFAIDIYFIFGLTIITISISIFTCVQKVLETRRYSESKFGKENECLKKNEIRGLRHWSIVLYVFSISISILICRWLDIGRYSTANSNDRSGCQRFIVF